MTAPSDTGCEGAEVFALRVLGDSMAPEFLHGEIVVIEPGGALHDGSFVLARVDEEWTLRQLARGPSGWTLRALQAGHREVALPDLAPVHGVVIQKAVPGRRRLSKRYI